MVEAKTYRGIDYVRISELPKEQQLAIQNWLNEDVVIKIMTESSLLSDCILFKDYSYWFEKIYTQAIADTAPEKVKVELQPQTKPVTGLAFD